MTPVYDGWLVALSCLIAALASYTALDLVSRVRTADRTAALIWWGAGAVTLGTGIWAMHFVGMLALALPVELGYAYGLTGLSWLCAVAVSGLALWLAGAGRMAGLRLYGGSLVMGAGICAMHYTGMLALAMDPAIRWSYGWVAVSVLVAVLSSWLALSAFARARRHSERRGLPWRLGASALMASGIAGMHYTGMAAAGFDDGSVCRSAESLHGEALFALIAAATLLLLTLILLLAALERRMARHRDRLEAQVAERTASLRQALLDAQSANAAKTQFLAAISHELRTPLTSIRGFAELIEGCSQEPATRTQAEYIRKGAEQLHGLLSEILDLSTIDAGAMVLKPVPLVLADLVRSTIDNFSRTAGDRGLALSAEIAPDCPGQFIGDELRIRQILHHLLSNAVKFTRHGSVRLSVEREGDQLLLHVDDTGPGIPAHLQALVFERFRQADARVSYSHGGTGLGLALSRSLAELMHGRLTLRSEPGQGCRFSLALPLGEAPSAAV